MGRRNGAARERTGRRRIPALVLVGVLLVGSACGAQAGRTPHPSPAPRACRTTALAVVLNQARELTAQVDQAIELVRGASVPCEILIVALAGAVERSEHRVQRGESLSLIAGAHGLSLETLLADNPQLTAVNGRDPNVIFPSDTVVIRAPSERPTALLVSRAPSGPPLPATRWAPAVPQDATSYTLARNRAEVVAAAAENDAQVTRWRTQVAATLAPWIADTESRLRALAHEENPATAESDTKLSGSIDALITSLGGIAGTRVLVSLATASAVPGDATLGHAAGAQVRLILAGVSSSVLPSLKAAASAQGTDAVVLDDILTRIELVSTVRSYIAGE